VAAVRSQLEEEKYKVKRCEFQVWQLKRHVTGLQHHIRTLEQQYVSHSVLLFKQHRWQVTHVMLRPGNAQNGASAGWFDGSCFLPCSCTEQRRCRAMRRLECVL